MEDCGSAVLAKGLCSTHYSRKRRTGSVEKASRAKVLCVICGTRWAKYKAGRCQACYRREKLGAKPIEGQCLHCGEGFTSKRRYSAESMRGMYCSRECKGAARVADGRAAESSRKHYYLKHYGLTVEEVDAMRAGGCDICGQANGEGRWGNLHVDHDHKTGRVRGALCSECNYGLGKFKDDPVLLRKAAAYLA